MFRIRHLRIPAAAACLILLAAPLAAQEGGEPAPTTTEAPPQGHECDPEVRAALLEAAFAGAQSDIALVRDEAAGIREPLSILDVSCIERLFNYSAYNVFFDPGRAMDEVLGLINRRICDVARDAYREAIGRPPDPGIYLRDLRQLPGVRVRPLRRNILELGTDDGADQFRTVIEDG